MKRATIATVLVSVGLLALAGCSGVREQLGLGRQSPDEFTVVSKAPLILPPDYALRPPAPGAPRPQEVTPERTARAALTGQSKVPGGGETSTQSSGEQVLIRLAGATGIGSEIREIVNRESSDMAERDKSFTDRLIFWRDPDPSGTVIDAAKEAKRIQENAAAGKPVTEGETPNIKRRKRAIFEGLF